MKRKKVPFSLRLIRVALGIISNISPGLAARWVYKIWFSTPRYPEPKREQRWREQAQLEYQDIGNARIAVYRWGPVEQPLVYLVHGWSGRSTQLAAFTQKLNTHGYTVIGFDAVGHGLSSGSSADIFQITSHLHTIIQRYGEPAHMITHSFGCMVAALLIRKYQVQPASLVVISSIHRAEYLIGFFASSFKINPGVLAIFRRHLLSEFGANVMHEVAAEKNLHTYNNPVLVLHDKQDRTVSWEFSRELAAAIPNVRTHYSEGLGHHRILRDRQIIDLVVRFFDETVRGEAMN